MKYIEIQDDLYEKLEELAIPFKETTPNIVLNRIISHYLSCDKRNDLAGDKPRRRFVTRKYGKLQHEHYRIPIIEALQASGGRGISSEIIEIVFAKVKDKLNEIDYTKTSTGIIRWQNTLRCQRNQMVKEGILKSDSPRGIWELNPEFKDQAVNHKTKTIGDEHDETV